VADFCTVENIEQFLNLSIQDDEDNVASCERAISAVMEAIKNYCQQEIEQVADEAITLDCDGGDMIFLPELPVISVASVVENDETLTVTDDYILGQHGILYRIGQDWYSGVQKITITYTHGHAIIPDDIQDVATRSAARVYQAGLRAKEHDGITGIASMSLEHGGGVGEGVMGASAARVLLMSEKDILDRYRYVRL